MLEFLEPSEDTVETVELVELSGNLGCWTASDEDDDLGVLIGGGVRDILGAR